MSAKETLLVVIDDDTEDLPCLARALQLAEAFNARIELFTAVYDTYIAGERLFDSEDLIAAKKKLLSDTLERLEDLARPLRDEGVEVTADVSWDEPVYEGIVRKALRTHPKMVIRNNHYHGVLKRSIFSNDDWNLIRTCPVPLLIARPQHEDNDRLRVCAAIDPVHANDKPASLDNTILGMAKSIVAASDGELSVLHSYDPAPVIASVGAGTMVPVITDVKGITEQVRDEHRKATVEVTTANDIPFDRVFHIEGNARTILPAFAIDQDIDIMVLGAVSRGIIQRTMLGNTAEKVLNKMPCDLLIVKPDDFETPVKFESRHRIQVDAA